MADILLMASDRRVILKGLKSTKTGLYISTAVVTAQITDADEADVGSAITCTYKASSNGEYYGTYPVSVVLTEGAWYTITITIVDPTAGTLTIKMKRVARYMTD